MLSQGLGVVTVTRSTGAFCDLMPKLNDGAVNQILIWKLDTPGPIIRAERTWLSRIGASLKGMAKHRKPIFRIVLRRGLVTFGPFLRLASAR